GRSGRAGSLPRLAEMVVAAEGVAQAVAERRPGARHVSGGLPAPSIDEQALLFAAQFVKLASGAKSQPSRAPARDRRRAVEATEWLDGHLDPPGDLQSAADPARLRPFPFLPLFLSVG